MAASLALIVPLALAACGGGGGGGGAPSQGSGASAPPTTLSITTSDVGQGRFATKAPGSIKGGLVKVVFENAGRMPHEAQLIRVDEGHTAREAVEIIGSEDSKTPKWLHAAGGVGVTAPGQQGTTITNLPAGRYAVVDTGSGGGPEEPSPATRGALAEFEVTQGTPGELPQTAATIVAKDEGAHGGSEEERDAGEHEHTFEANGLKAGKNTVLFDNRSDEIHHVVMAPIVGDTPIEEVEKALASEEEPEGPPPVDFQNTVITSVLDGQTKEVTDLQLRKGRYALLCFVSDRDGGKPHFLEGMFEEITIN
ncbi:MAG TPA: hypothetical protein VGV40_10520 [Solirubrobacteraceae bacterium]|nr:hypothetical protein [Solirubrobacteraceae bacterium]